MGVFWAVLVAVAMVAGATFGTAYDIAAYADDDILLINGHPYAFVVDDDTGIITIMDITTPYAPLMASTITNTNAQNSHMVAFSMNDSHYVAVYDSEGESLRIFDVTNPYVPAFVSDLHSGEFAHAGILTGLDVAHTDSDTLVLLAFDDVVYAVSVSDVYGPTITRTIQYGWGHYALDDISHMDAFETNDNTYVLLVGTDSAIIVDVDEYFESAGVSIWPNTYGFADIGEFTDVKTIEQDSHMYGVISGTDSVMVVDLTDHRDPRQVGIIRLNSDDTQILQIDTLYQNGANYVLVLDGRVLHAIDVTDVTKPAVVSSVDAGPGFDSVAGFEHDGEFGVLLDGNDMMLWDVTDIANPMPAYMGKDRLPMMPVSVETIIIQDTLYAITVSNVDNSIKIFDITNQNDIVFMSEVAGGQFGYKGVFGPHDIAITQDGDRVYAAVPNVNDDSVVILDISNPHKPTIISSIHDTAELMAPVEVEILDIDSRTYVAVASNYVNGIYVIDITDAHLPKPTVLMPDGQYGFDALLGTVGLEFVTINDTPYLLATGYYNSGIQIIDMTNPGNPIPVSSILDGKDGYNIGGAYNIEAATMQSGTYAVVTSVHDDSISIIDITNPSSPTLSSEVTNKQDAVDKLTSPQYLDIVQTDGNTFVLVTSYYDASVNVIDITNPSSPVVLSTVVDDMGGFEMLGPLGISAKVYNGNVYAAVAAYFDNSLQVIDMSDMSSPEPFSLVSASLEHSVSLFGSHDVGHVVVDDSVYAMSAVFSEDAVRVADISDPYGPVPVSVIRDGESFALDGPVGVTSGVISGTPYGIISGVWSGTIQVVDMSDPHSPVPVSVIRDGVGDFEGYDGIVEVDLAYIDTRVYGVAISAFNSLVQIVDLTDPSEPAHVYTIHDGRDGFVVTYPEGVDVFYTSDGVFAVISGFAPGTFQIIDISDPHNPKPVSTMTSETKGFESATFVTDVTTIQTGDKIVMAAVSYRTDTVIMADITDPYNVMPINTIRGGDPGFFIRNMESIESITIGDDAFLAVASGRDSVELINITDPHNPVPAGLGGTGLVSTLYGITDLDSVKIGSNFYILALAQNPDISYIIEINDSGLEQVSVIPPVPVS